jgi:hypothetical protein
VSARGGDVDDVGGFWLQFSRKIYSATCVRLLVRLESTLQGFSISSSSILAPYDIRPLSPEPQRTSFP